MSVTFTIEANPTGAFIAKCYDGGNGTVVAEADSYEGVLVQIEVHKALCEECAAYGLYSQPVMDVSDDLDVNVANTNARILIDALGLSLDDEGDLYGTVDGEQFLGAVLLAMASDRDDSGVAPAVVGREVGQSGATMVDCGLRPGYFGDRFGALYALATEAVRLGRAVTFS